MQRKLVRNLESERTNDNGSRARVGDCLEVGSIRVEETGELGVVRMGLPAWVTCIYEKRV